MALARRRRERMADVAAGDRIEPAARRHAAIMPVVVVLPFVPVTATYGRPREPRARAPSRPRRGAPARAPTRGLGAASGTPGPVDDERRAVEVRAVVTARAHRRPRARRRSHVAEVVGGGAGSVTRTSAPSAQQHRRGRGARDARAHHHGALTREPPAHLEPSLAR